MSRSPNDDRLIEALAAELRPVRPLRPPFLRAAVWLGTVAVLAALLAVFSDLGAVGRRLAAAPDLYLAVVGSVLTSILGAVAVFELGVPGRSRAWVLLPLPALLLWVGASGLGCLRAWLAPDTHVAVLGEARDCLVFIVSLSLPLAVVLFAMLRRAHALYPGLAAATGGLAVAAAAASLLNFFHPFDAAATDLAVHAVAVAGVVAISRAFAGRILAR